VAERLADRAVAWRIGLFAGLGTDTRRGNAAAPAGKTVERVRFLAARVAGGSGGDPAVLRALVRLARRLVLWPAFPVRNDASAVLTLRHRLQRLAGRFAAACGGRNGGGVRGDSPGRHVRLQRPSRLAASSRTAGS